MMPSVIADCPDPVLQYSRQVYASGPNPILNIVDF